MCGEGTRMENDNALLAELDTLRKLTSRMIQQRIDPPFIHDNEQAYYTKRDLCLCFGVSRSTVDTWIRAGMPVLRRGQKGMVYIRRKDAELFLGGKT